MIKTVIFDLGGVYFTDGTKRAIDVISSNYHVSEEKVKEVLKGELGTKYRIGAVTAGEFWKKAKRYWGIDAHSSELADIWFKGYKPIKGTVSIVDRLNIAGYEVIFLSDNVHERIDYLQKKYSFLHKFKAGVFSHIVKIRKPDLRIYQLVLKQASHPAKECVYIDDKAELLEPAKRIGMAVIAFENPLQLEKKLKKLGLKF